MMNQTTLPRVFDYLVIFKTTEDCLTEAYRVRAETISTAIECAQRAAAPKHPRATLRVAYVRETGG